ncbi:MAG: response regulator [Pseudomonadales bacterium]|nr:response regulator [Pseudomonadales bacterium]
MIPVKILVVDDAALIRDMVKRTLRRQFENTDIETAVNGLKAQSRLKGKLFDLILCDWEMPELDGGELLHWVRQQDRTSHIPFIMVTSRGDKDFVMKAAKEGVSGYLTKPFTNEQLLICVMKALKKSGKLKQACGDAATNSSKQQPDDSVSLLTGAGSKPSTPVKDKPAVTDGFNALIGNNASHESPKQHTPDAAPPKQKTASPVKQPTAHLRYKQGVHQCMIKDINLKEVLAVLRADSEMPDLLEQTVVHINNSKSDETVQLNGFVHSMAATQRKMDAQFVSIKVVFVDEDPKKLEHLSHFIQSM